MFLDHAHAHRRLGDPNDDIEYLETQQDIIASMETHEKIFHPDDARKNSTELGRFRGVLCAACNTSEAFDFSRARMNEYRGSSIKFKDVDTSPAALKKGRKASTLTNVGRY